MRSCPGEPYHEDFYKFDSVTGVAYKRHRVLFNLYNFDRQRSYYAYSSDTSTYTKKLASLTLTNCKFSYFLADYEALIHVQTNNLAIIQPSTASSKPYIEELGDERGVKITIASSTFKHSRFCKGMLVYKKRPLIQA